MPPSVPLAISYGVMPFFLSVNYTRSEQYEMLENTYPDGNSQRRALATTSMKRWQLSVRLSPTMMKKLYDFYISMGGGHKTFYFYDHNEVEPPRSYDEQGDDLYGRYLVRFGGQFKYDLSGPSRVNSNFELYEVA